MVGKIMNTPADELILGTRLQGSIVTNIARLVSADHKRLS